MIKIFQITMPIGRLTFIGLGLYDEKDISLKGLDEIKNCDKVYAEFYTAILAGTDIKKIEKTIGKKIEVLSREETEKGEKIIKDAESKDIVFLTCGDPMTATTHIDLRLRAIKKNIKTRVIHSSSIATAVPGILGLQNYKFGRTTTLAYPEKDYFPTSPYDIIKDNKKMGLHTLILLDIQADKKRYMTANEGMELLLKMEEKLKGNIFKKDSIICVVARAGSAEPITVAGHIKDLIDRDYGPPLHTLVIPGKLHFMEIESLQLLAQLPAQQIIKIQKL
jgi:diphthine synthase